MSTQEVIQQKEMRMKQGEKKYQFLIRLLPCRKVRCQFCKLSTKIGLTAYNISIIMKKSDLFKYFIYHILPVLITLQKCSASNCCDVFRETMNLTKYQNQRMLNLSSYKGGRWLFDNPCIPTETNTHLQTYTYIHVDAYTHSS